MLCYALLVCITAFMFILRKNCVESINFQPLPPFGGNFLEEVSDFDCIVEPEVADQESGSNVIKTRDSMEGGKAETTEKCLSCTRENDYNSNKRELVDMGEPFVDKFFEDDRNSVERLERDYEDSEESAADSEYAEDEDENNRTDSEVSEETNRANNLSETVKVQYDQIENPPLTADDDDQKACCEEETEKKADEEERKGETKAAGRNGNVKTLFEVESPKKSKMGSADNFLEMHFYKYLPEAEGAKLEEDGKHVTIDLYPEMLKKEASLKVPEKYDYIALFSDNKNLEQVPAVEFTVVTEGTVKMEENRRRRDGYNLLSVSKRRRRSPGRFKFKPTSNIFKVVDGDRLRFQNFAHISTHLVNIIQKKISRLEKRSPTFDSKDNQYIREADLLIQNVNTSLEMGLNDIKKSTQVEEGNLVNTKSQNSSWSRVFRDIPSPALNSESSENLGKNLRVQGLVKSNISPVEVASNQEENLVNQDDGNSVETASRREASLMKHELDPFSPLQDNLVQNDLNSVDAPSVKENHLVNNDFNSMETDYMAKSAIDFMEFTLPKGEGLVSSEHKSEILPSNENPIKSEVLNSPLKKECFGKNRDDTITLSKKDYFGIGSADATSDTSDYSDIKKHSNQGLQNVQRDGGASGNRFPYGKDSNLAESLVDAKSYYLRNSEDSANYAASGSLIKNLDEKDLSFDENTKNNGLA